MFLLVGFHRLLRVHQFTVLSSCDLLFLPQGVAEGADALLIIVKLGQTQLEAVLVKLVHQPLVPLGLEKWEVGGTSQSIDRKAQEKLKPVTTVHDAIPVNTHRGAI